MTVTFCTSGSVKLKAGADATELTDDQYTELINQAENALNIAAKIPEFNLIDNFGALDDSVKKLLEDGASSYAAMSAISYDLGAFGSLRNAETLLDVNFTKYQTVVNLIREKPHTDFMRKQ